MRPADPPVEMNDEAFWLLVKKTPYKMKRLDQTLPLQDNDRLDQTSAIVPAPSKSLSASSGISAGPFAAAMMAPFMQAAMDHWGMPPAPACPTLRLGPFHRKESTVSARSDASYAVTEAECPATEIDPDSGEDQLEKVETGMKTAKLAVKKAKTKAGAATSASDPTEPKPKTKARRDKNATRRAKLLAAVPLPAPKVAMKAPMAMKAATVAMKAPSKAGATAKVKAKAAATIKKKTTVATKATAKVTAKVKANEKRK